MGSLGRKVSILCGLLLLAACARREEPVSIFGQPEEPVGTVTIFSEGSGPQAPPASPEPALEEKKEVRTLDPPPRPPKAGLNRRYPPPVPPDPPLAPRGPPIPPRYSLEPPPSKVKAFPDFKVERLGIWECDNYTSQYLICINQRVPRNQDTKLAKALSQKVGGWKLKAGTAEGREVVAQECREAMQRTKKAMQPYVCTWR
ncbi:MAG TPA: hypothetical protein VFW62_04340 [bacterium]|nr:hypothetical protein [bacterium]